MKEYKLDNIYNIIILKRNNGIYEFYLEKIGYANLAFMFGIREELSPHDFKTSYINGFIKEYETQKFWNN